MTGQRLNLKVRNCRRNTNEMIMSTLRKHNRAQLTSIADAKRSSLSSSVLLMSIVSNRGGGSIASNDVATL